MKFKIGDFVAVLDDVVKGVISKIEVDHVFIKDDTDMEFKYLPSELVKIEEDQHELSKYSDINHQHFKEKQTAEFSKKKSVFKKTKNEVVFEVDLHINKLVNSTLRMDNFDMLNLQAHHHL